MITRALQRKIIGVCIWNRFHNFLHKSFERVRVYYCNCNNICKQMFTNVTACTDTQHWSSKFNKSCTDGVYIRGNRLQQDGKLGQLVSFIWLQRNTNKYSCTFLPFVLPCPCCAVTKLRWIPEELSFATVIIRPLLVVDFSAIRNAYLPLGHWTYLHQQRHYNIQYPGFYVPILRYAWRPSGGLQKVWLPRVLWHALTPHSTRASIIWLHQNATTTVWIEPVTSGSAVENQLRRTQTVSLPPSFVTKSKVFAGDLRRLRHFHRASLVYNVAFTNAM